MGNTLGKSGERRGSQISLSLIGNCLQRKVMSLSVLTHAVVQAEVKLFPKRFMQTGETKTLKILLPVLIMRSLLELLHHHAWELVGGVTAEC
jgi:hypothetical protein